MRQDDRSYFILREAQERAAADQATCPQVAAAHREMAERYAALLTRLTDPVQALSA